MIFRQVESDSWVGGLLMPKLVGVLQAALRISKRCQVKVSGAVRKELRVLNGLTLRCGPSLDHLLLILELL